MLRIFNSFQIVCAFVAWPFLINWLSTAEFRGAPLAFYSSAAVYVVGFIAMIAAVNKSLDDF